MIKQLMKICKWYMKLMDNVYKSFIVDRAYIGYLIWMEKEQEKYPHQIIPIDSFEDFKKLELWKIEMAFKLYFGWVKHSNMRNFRVSFSMLLLDTKK